VQRKRCLALSNLLLLGLSVILSASAADEPLREGPARIRGVDAGVAQLVPDLQFKDIKGNAGNLGAHKSSKAIVIAMISPACPVSKRYGPTLANLEQEYVSKGVGFIFVSPIENTLPSALEAASQIYGWRGPVIQDADQKIATALGANSTTEVFVLDAARTLVIGERLMISTAWATRSMLPDIGIWPPLWTPC
jgi:thiol-disulfide isomerase/thioredoxin